MAFKRKGKKPAAAARTSDSPPKILGKRPVAHLEEEKAEPNVKD